MMTVMGTFALPLSAQVDTDILMQEGEMYYDQEDYAAARTRFEQLITISPENSRYHHWLGKCYGRLAENSGWLEAISFSKKTLKALEIAVELDNENIPALRDLMTYYQQAPGFLGGSDKKARNIAKHLQKLQDADSRKKILETSSAAY